MNLLLLHAQFQPRAKIDARRSKLSLCAYGPLKMATLAVTHYARTDLSYVSELWICSGPVVGACKWKVVERGAATAVFLCLESLGPESKGEALLAKVTLCF